MAQCGGGGDLPLPSQGVSNQPQGDAVELRRVSERRKQCGKGVIAGVREAVVARLLISHHRAQQRLHPPNHRMGGGAVVGSCQLRRREMQVVDGEFGELGAVVESANLSRADQHRYLAVHCEEAGDGGGQPGGVLDALVDEEPSGGGGIELGAAESGENGEAEFGVKGGFACR